MVGLGLNPHSSIGGNAYEERTREVFGRISTVERHVAAAESEFSRRPASAKTEKNNYLGQKLSAGKTAFDHNCAACHGPQGEGSGNVPALSSGAAQGASRRHGFGGALSLWEW
jgi:mono/diheme cytochrome c family protein